MLTMPLTLSVSLCILVLRSALKEQCYDYGQLCFHILFPLPHCLCAFLSVAVILCHFNCGYIVSVDAARMCASNLTSFALWHDGTSHREEVMINFVVKSLLCVIYLYNVGLSLSLSLSFFFLISLC